MSKETFRAVSRMSIDGVTYEPGDKISGDLDKDVRFRGWLRAGNIVRQRKKSPKKKGVA